MNYSWITIGKEKSFAHPVSNMRNITSKTKTLSTGFVKMEMEMRKKYELF